MILKNKILKFFLGLILSVGFLIIIFYQIDFLKVIYAFSKISWILIILALILYITSYIFRTIRFKLILKNKISFKKLFLIVCIHNLINQIIPARIGELSYVYLTKKEGINLSRGVVSLTLARIFDFLTVMILFSISMFFISQPHPIVLLLFTVWGIIFFLIITFFIIIFFFYKKIKKNIIKYQHKTQNKALNFILSKISIFIDELEIINSKKRMIKITISSLLVWLPLYLIGYFVFLDLNSKLNIWTIFIGSTLPLLTSVLPINGFLGLGTVEATWSVAYFILGVNKELAISSGFIVHLLQINFFIMLGGIALLIRKTKFYNRFL